MRAAIVYIVLALLFAGFPTESRGQYVKVESMSQVTDAAVLYSDGIFPSAIWELGRNLTDKNTSATFRHTVNDGNGDNLNVNSKLPLRLLIAPTDLQGLTWSQAMGFDAQNNNNLEATPVGGVIQSGCRNYTPSSDFPGYAGVKGWRLPTQRELQLMWLLHDAIDQAFLKSGKYNKRHKLSGNYWSATEENATQAWYFGFDGPLCWPIDKTTQYKVRCVRDY